MTKQKQKPYKEVVEKLLYTKDYFNDNDYPENRVKVELISYSGEYQDQDNNVVGYEGEKVKITNSKLQKQDDTVIVKQKIKGSYIVNDEQVVKLKINEFDDLLKSLNGVKI